MIIFMGSGEVVSSTEIVDNTLVVTSGESGFHMRPIVALGLLLKDFERMYGVNLEICVGDQVYNAQKLSVINLTLAGLVRGKQFSLRACDGILPEDALKDLQERMIRLDEIGQSVPNAINRILAGL